MHVNPDLLALMALGEPLETADERRHLAGCRACQQDLASLQNVVAVGRRTSEQDVLRPPAPRVWERISDELELHARPAHDAGAPVNGASVTPISSIVPPARRRPAADSTVGSDEPSIAADGDRTGSSTGGPEGLPVVPRPSSRGLRAASLALAAVLALVVGIGIGTNLDRLLVGRTETAAVQLNALPPWPGSSGRAVVEEDRDGNRWLVVEISSPTPATGPREVWLTNTKADPMVAVGFLSDDEGRFPIAPDINLADYYLIDVSQEPAQDADPDHSGQSMLRGRLPV